MPYKENLGKVEFSEVNEVEEKKEISLEEINKLKQQRFLSVIDVFTQERPIKFENINGAIKIENQFKSIDTSYYTAFLASIKKQNQNNLQKFNEIDLPNKVLILNFQEQSPDYYIARQRYWKDRFEDYRMYMESIRTRLKFKFLRSTDEKIAAYERKLKKEQIRIQLYEDERIYPEKKIYSEEQLNQTIIPEYKVVSSKLSHPLFWIKLENWINIEKDYQTQQQVILENIKEILLNYHPDKEIQSTVRFLEQLRMLDRIDGDYNYYNSYKVSRIRFWELLGRLNLSDSNYIKLTQTIDSIVQYPHIKKEFSKLFEIKDKKQFVQQFITFYKTYFQDNSFDLLNQESLQRVAENIYQMYQMKDKIKEEKLKDIEKEFMLRIEVYLEEIDEQSRQALKKEIFDESWWLSPLYQYKLDQTKQEFLTAFDTKFVEILLDQTANSLMIEYFKQPLNTEKLKQIDPKLYELFKDIFTGFTDEQFNKVSEFTYEFLYALVSMYMWWLVAVSIRSVIVEGLFMWHRMMKMDLYTLYKTDKILALSSLPYRAKVLMLEWVVFDLTTQTLMNIKQAKSMKEIYEYDGKSILRTIIFLWVLRGLKRLSPNISEQDKALIKLVKEWIDISLDTTKLIWTDILIKAYIDKDVLPNDWGWLRKLLSKELEEILPFVIWLRLAESRIWWGYYINKKISLYFRSKGLYISEWGKEYSIKELKQAMENKQKYFWRWRLESRRNQKENVATEKWKNIKEFVKRLTLYEIMKTEDKKLELNENFNRLIESLENWQMNVEQVINKGKELIREIAERKAHREFGKLNDEQWNVINKRIKKLQEAWEKLVRIIEKLDVVKLSEKIKEYKEYIWKTPEQVEFVRRYFDKIYKIKVLERKKYNNLDKSLDY